MSRNTINPAIRKCHGNCALYYFRKCQGNVQISSEIWNFSTFTGDFPIPEMQLLILPVIVQNH